MTAQQGPTVRVSMDRHRTRRRHSTWVADVPLEILGNPLMFNKDGTAKPAFDQWICDNGDETDVEYSDDGNPDAEDLNYEVLDVGPIVWPGAS